ncbi:MAG TPA: hypothetical protein VGH45_09880 [Solirubrobacteraceae bacterium]|jgi:hypothetical protein
MAEDHPRTGPRHEHERHYERSADPAESADRPLEPKSSSEPLAEADVPEDQPGTEDPHHALNNPVGTPDPTADSDPYRPETAEDDLDRASGSRGSGQGAEDR